MTCSQCNHDLDHCHGTLVIHAEAPADCTDPDCADFGIVRHTLVLDCAEIDGRCSCSVVAEDTQLLRVS
ncbi:hypothetical protein [Rhodococcus sp. CH91]|uniref:hypothetical protein n=1 Tax=Rhodococcus sp. CH91 TaxID=2910256 RepID=UPI001F4B8F2A|nr:hypothetical protein [Rhodococcus sp. CH91]